MPGFDYANARLRAMKSRLLPAETLFALTDEGDLSSLMNALTRTPYQESVELALVGNGGLPGYVQALQRDLSGRVEKIQRFFTDKSAELVRLVLRRYDVDNIKAVLRGLSQQLAAEDILAATIHRGSLTTAELRELAQVGNAREAIDLLATWRVPLAQPLLTIRIEQPGAALWEMEMALEHHYFQEVAAERRSTASALHEYLELYADTANMMTVLRLVGMNGRAVFLRRQFSADDPKPLLIGPGRLPFKLLVEAAQEESVPEAVDVLSQTIFYQTLEEGLQQFRSTRRLSSFEEVLYRLRLKQATSFFIRDFHGIGILIGYLVLSNNEIANLLRIGQGIYLRRPTIEIQADLVVAAS